jgi:hypothetical protein
VSAWIAEQEVTFVHPGGKRTDGVIGIGMPFPGPPNATCTYSLDGLDPGSEPRDPPLHIAGEDTLQALLLTVQFVGMALHHFTSRGGRVVFRSEGPIDPAAPDEDDDDIDFPLAMYFGPLLIDRSPS